MWMIEAPARAAAMPDSAISCGVTGTGSLFPAVSPAPVRAQGRLTLRFIVRVMVVVLPDGFGRVRVLNVGGGVVAAGLCGCCQAGWWPPGAVVAVRRSRSPPAGVGAARRGGCRQAGLSPARSMGGEP